MLLMGCLWSILKWKFQSKQSVSLFRGAQEVWMAGRDGEAAPLSNHLRVLNRIQKRLAGLTLTELLCVIAILAILASLYLGTLIKTFARVVKFLKGF
jgi:prepilin-type N-terminal cleavage/methylation domain-containing protein